MKYILIFALCMSTYFILAPIVGAYHRWKKEMDEQEEQDNNESSSN